MAGQMTGGIHGNRTGWDALVLEHSRDGSCWISNIMNGKLAAGLEAKQEEEEDRATQVVWRGRPASKG